VSPIDDEALDRLADYTAGVLDPAGAARVRVLIDTDPDWARAYAGLTAAAPRLDAALSTLADPPMPTEVAERLSTVLALQSPPEGTRTAAVVPISSHRRWLRRGAGITAVAAAVAAVFGGVLQLAQSPYPSSNSAGSAGAPVSRPQAAASGPGLTIVHSGRNYTAQTVGQADAATTFAAPVAPAPTERAPSVMSKGGAADDTALNRLLDPASLSQCLAAVVGRYGGEPVVADFAEFNGAPALIVVLAVPSGRRIVVAGPSCGLPGYGPDERYSVVG
jgi:hypothetical protein